MASEAATRCGERIRDARKLKGWTQRELARELPGKVDGPSISRWERGIVMPSPANLDALAKVLVQDLAYFMAGGSPSDAAGDAQRQSDLDSIQLQVDESVRLLSWLVQRLASAEYPPPPDDIAKRPRDPKPKPESNPPPDSDPDTDGKPDDS